MSYTTGTTHYNLPLTTNNDKRDWTDTNQAFTDVDAALYGAVSDASTQGEEITALDTRLTTAEGNISTNAANITALDTRLTTAEGNITSQGTQIADVRSDAEDMICAYNEATATSTHAYAIGDYFIYNDVLYRTTAPIAIGDTIVPDTNCTTTNVTTELMSAGSDAVDMICTVVENTTTATRNYAVGDYFILNDVLYRVTATITVGTTIIPETNCTRTNVSTELNEISSNYAELSNDSGWIRFNPASGVNNVSIYRKVGSIVYVCAIVNAPVTDGTVLGVLPEGYRPAVQLQVANYRADSDQNHISITTDGEVTKTGTGSSWINCMLVYPV